MKTTFPSLLALLFTVSANAAILDLGNITRDTSTGLEWLDLTETVGRSHIDISQNLLPGEEFAGWRYATESEVQVLWQNFGLEAGTTEVVLVADTVQYAAFVSAVTTLGNIHKDAGVIFDFGTVGITGTLVDGFTNGYYTRGMHHEIGDNDTRISAGADGLFETTASIHHGSYLVREVPLPAAFWLFLTSVCGLAGARFTRAT